MHYKNGREAHNGEPVIGKSLYSPVTLVGFIQDINPGCTTCNCTVLRPGGLVQSCVTVGELYHADDAIACIEAEWAKSKAAMMRLRSGIEAMGLVPMTQIAVTSQVVEKKVYSDGTVATGPGPLPELSPAQQEAAA